ncbi:MAG: carbohydrate binding domain-containing protein, partial [Phycisphaerae bacterium]|nr:carbohydrate binding domain-containing protein [Phycisphaerae bacterium]
MTKPKQPRPKHPNAPATESASGDKAKPQATTASQGSFVIEPLEKRILLSATWIDADDDLRHGGHDAGTLGDADANELVHMLAQGGMAPQGQGGLGGFGGTGGGPNHGGDVLGDPPAGPDAFGGGTDHEGPLDFSDATTGISIDVTAPTLPADEPSENLMTNGGFDNGLDGWSRWDARHIDVVDAHSGEVYASDHAAKFAVHGGPGQQLIQQVTGLEAGKEYTLTTHVNANDLTHKDWDGAGFQVNVGDDKYGDVLDRAVVSDDTDGWQEVKINFTAPDDGQVWVRSEFYGVRSGEVYVDEFSLTPADAAGHGADPGARADAFHVIGSDYDDTFAFSDPEPGAVYTVDGGQGHNTIDLSHFDLNDASFHDGAISVDMGDGNSFDIHYEHANTVRFGDAVATVLDGHHNASDFSGSGVFVDGGQAFRIDVDGHGTVDWSYDAASDTLHVTDNDGTDPSTTLTITDLAGNDLHVDHITLDTDLGAVHSNVDLGTVDLVGKADIGEITVAGGHGYVGTIHDAGNADTSLTVNAAVGTLSIDVDLNHDLTVNGDLHHLIVGDDINQNAHVAIAGHVAAFDVSDEVRGSVGVTGDVGSVAVGGHLSGNLAVDGRIDALTAERITGDVSISGSAGTIVVNDDSGSGDELVGNLNVGGDLKSLHVGDDIKGNVNVSGDIGEIVAGDEITGNVGVAGNLGTVAVGGNLSGNLTVDGHIDSLSAERVTGDVSIAGNAGIIVVNDDSGSGDEFAGGLTVGGSLDSLVVGDDIKGNVTIGQSIGQIVAGDEIKGNVISVGGSLGGLQAGRIDSDIRVGGSLGPVRVDDPSGGNDGFTGSLTVGGSVASIDVTDTLKADIQVAGSVGSISAGDDLGGSIHVAGDVGSISVGDEMKHDGDIVVDGNVGSITVGDRADKNITIGGDLDSFKVEKDFRGVLTAGRVNGHFDLVDGKTEYHLNFDTDTAIHYDGKTDTLTYESVAPSEPDHQWSIDAGQDLTVDELSEVTLGVAVDGVGHVSSSDFESDASLDAWATTSGSWEIVDGYLHDTRDGENRIWLEEPAGEDYEIHLTARIDEGNGFGVWMTEQTNPPTGYTLQYDPGYGKDGSILLRRWEDGKESVIASADFDGQWHGVERDFVVRVQDDTFTLEIDGQKVLEAHDDEFGHANVGLRTWHETELYVDDFSVTSLDGAPAGNLTYEWVQTGGPKVELSDPHAANPTFTAPEGLGNSKVTFDVHVSNGSETLTDSVTVTILADNDAPTAHAGPDQTASEGNIVHLSGTGHDPEGQALKYMWVQTGGPKVELSDPNAPNPTFTAPEGLSNSEVTFELRVSDGHNTSVDTVAVTINADNDAPTAEAGPDQAVDEGDLVHLSGTGQDPEGQDLKYMWVQTSGPKVELSDPNAPDPTFTAPEGLSNSEVTFELHVSDGQNTSVDTVAVTVNADNDAPTAEAGPDQTVDEGDIVHLSGSAHDPEGQDLKYMWVQTGGPKVELSDPNAPDPTFTAPEGLSNSEVTFELHVSDGANTSVDTVAVTINADNDAPTANAGPDQTVDEGDVVMLSGSAQDPEGQALNYTWVQTSGPKVQLSDPNAPNPTFTAPEGLSNSEVTFELRVSDGHNTSVDTVAVTINADNDAPTADAGPNQSVEEGDIVQLSGTGADPEGQGLTYTWVQTGGPKVELSDPHAASPTFTAPEGLSNSKVTFELHVSDGANTSVDTVAVTINADNDAPTAQAGPDQAVDEGDLVRLAGSGTDPEGQDLMYRWVQTGGPSVELSDGSASRPTFEAPRVTEPTTLTFQVEVSDGDNISVDTVQITVNPVLPEPVTFPHADDFSDGKADGFEDVRGDWQVADGAFDVTGLDQIGQDGVAVLHFDEPLPEGFQIDVTLIAENAPGQYQNGFVIFDYHGPNDFKFAGARVGADYWTIGHYDG